MTKSEIGKRYRAKNRAKLAAYNKQYKAKYRVRDLEYERRRRGLPAPTRPMPEACELCGGPPPPRFTLSLDHDHETGKFRGWLCTKCNVSIGGLGDTEEGLQRAIHYLRVCRALTP